MRRDVTADEVARLYFDENRSIPYICKQLHTSHWLVCDRLNHLGLARRPIVREDVLDLEIKKLYLVAQLSIRDVGDALHCSRETVRMRLNAMGISRRPNIKDHVSDETRKRISAARKGYQPSEYARRRVSESNSGAGNGNWKGGRSYEPYCPAFTEKLKEIVRAEFGRKCFLCAKPEDQNGRKLAVHHVDYQKSQGCAGQKWSLIPLCNSCHSKTGRNRSYWFCLLRDYWLNKYLEFNSNPF